MISRCKLWMLLLILATILSGGAEVAQAEDGPVVRVVYFYSEDCAHCLTVADEVLDPLKEQYGSQLEIKQVCISDPEAPSGLNAVNYEMLIQAEEMFDISPEERGIPTLLINGQALVGEKAIREQLSCLLDTCLVAGGTSWPDIPGLNEIDSESSEWPGPGLGPGIDVTPCSSEATSACEVSDIWIAYFYEVGCSECSSAEYDIRYVQSKYPQLKIEKHNIQDDAALAEWLGANTGVSKAQRLSTPMLFVGEDYLIGSDITSQAVLALAEKYAPTGAERAWDNFDPQEAEKSILERFQSFGVLTVILGGLVDGLNPCAFATLAFFISYLTLSGRKGREILTVGAAFTLGVFLAYLTVGLGFYKILDLLGGLLSKLEQWVYGLTGLLCAGLAMFSFFDFLKARRGEIGDMALNLPHGLRMRINAVIRGGRKSETFVIGAFITGIAVSFLELACTGQVYVPIIFAIRRPEMRSRAFFFLVIYNLLFILPLLVVFVLAYYGTTSKQLTRFLQERAANVKLGMTLLFAALATWLVVSVFV